MKIFRLRNKIIILVLLATLLAYGCFVEPFRLKIEHLSYDYTLSDKKITWCNSAICICASAMI